LVDEEDLFKFTNTHPGCENDGLEEEVKTPFNNSKATVEPIRMVERNPPPGIPDSFVPGDWRGFC